MEKLAEGLTNSSISIIAGNKRYFYPKIKGFTLDKVDFFIGLTSVINFLIPKYPNCAFDLKHVLGLTGSKIDSGKESIRIVIPEECAAEFLGEWNNLCIKEEPIKVHTSEFRIKTKKGTIDWEKSKKEIDEVFAGTRESTSPAMADCPGYKGPKIAEVIEVREDDKGNKEARVTLADKETIEKILKNPKTVVIPKKEEEKKESKKIVQDTVVETKEKKTPKKKRKASKND